ncbi:acetylxylan esterase [Cerasicoccus arenae]|uniref:Acetylxylan esterase n=2 Tax=Cerasicoccus arenae TaxID=424488 RepID=A0A8J3GDS4_9BACT|nr:acetylxylan esterase [Cerasicoccus arenae]
MTDYTLLGWMVFLGGGTIMVLQLIVPNWQGACDVVTNFLPAGKSVWLTIDDGPDPEDTPRLLELLAAHQAKATFFLIGQRAEQYPELVDAIRASGHEIGCHTYTHPTRTFWLAGRCKTRRELDCALPHIERERGEVTLYRSPVGIKSIFLRGLLQQRGLRCVGWTIRSGDGLGQDPDVIVHRVVNNVRPGAIILMHEGYRVASAVRIVAIQRVLESLTRDGYDFIQPTTDQLRTVPVKSLTPEPTTTTKELLCN